MSGRCDECGEPSTQVYCVDCGAWPAELRAAKAEGAAEEREAWSRVTGQPDADALSSYLGRLTLPEADVMHGRAMEERALLEREACIRDVCGRCRDGQPVELFAGWWAHRILNSKEHPFECAAHSIRARGAKEKP